MNDLKLVSYALGPALIIAAKYILAFPVSYHYINGMRHLVSIPDMVGSRGGTEVKDLELGNYALGPALIIAAKYILAFPVSYHYINGMRHLVSISIVRGSRGREERELRTRTGSRHSSQVYPRLPSILPLH